MPTSETKSGLILYLARHISQVTQQLSGRRLTESSQQKLREAQTLMLDATMVIAELLGAPLQDEDE
jgi:hypothetical protein